MSCHNGAAGVTIMALHTVRGYRYGSQLLAISPPLTYPSPQNVTLHHPGSGRVFPPASVRPSGVREVA
jgi:hypothetical protein